MAKITGTKRSETLLGTTGNDQIFGLEGNDLLSGLGGADSLIGGIGNDTYIVDNIGDKVIEKAGEGTDLVQASISFTLANNVENLTLTGTKAINATGNSAVNILTGNGAANILDGKGGADKMIGGNGSDTYVVDVAGDLITEKANEGTDLVKASVSYTLAANVENLTLTGTGAINATGNGISNILTGNNGANILDGKAGADTMVGGLGADTYVVDNAGDVVTEASGGGTSDLVQSSISYTLTAHVERLTLTGALAINGTGNDLDNILTGNGAANSLNGGLGADTMIGGLSNDTYVVDNAGDVVTENSGGGTADLVQSSISYTLTANVERLTLTGSDAINATGNELGNVLTGNSGNNSLSGGLGADTMIGGAGNDNYLVDNSADVVTEGLDGYDTVYSSASFTLSENIEQLILTGDGAINGTGNSIANNISGTSGNNMLDGGAGADNLYGYSGDDTFIVDDANDFVQEYDFDGDDLVKASVTYTLSANVERLTLTGSEALDGTGNELANVLTGNGAANVLDGGAGADTMIGGDGSDTYVVDQAGDVVTEDADQGADLVRSAISYTLGANVENLTLTGSDTVDGTGNEFGNVLAGNDGNNVLSGGAGDDTLTAGLGVDQLYGGADNDTYALGNDADDQINDSSGDDTVTSTISRTLTSFLGVEKLTLLGTDNIDAAGNASSNILTGNDGNNTLFGDDGLDTLIGGAGDDTYALGADSDIIIESSGADVITSSISRTLADFVGIEGLTLLGSDNLSGTGDDSNNVITGNSGNNTLSGGLGTDTLDGGTGADVMVGGDDADTYYVDDVGDVVTEVGFGFIGDTVVSSLSYTLGANVEDLTLGGTANLNGTGNSLSNTLFGNDGNNILDGGEGGASGDRFYGGKGNDTFIVWSSMQDVYISERVNQGSDTIQTSLGSVGLSSFFYIENVTLTGSGNYDANGSSVGNKLTGNDGQNTINGLGGTDTLYGGLGNDSIDGGTEDDLLDGGRGDDAMTGGSGNDTFVFATEAGAVETGFGADTISGFSAGSAAGDVLKVGTEFNSYSALQAAGRITESGGDTTITFDTASGTSTIRLIGVAAWQLNANDFLFA